jgi:ABC-2 type transport system permease protein
MISVRRIAIMAGKEAREIIRDRLFFSLTLVVPPILMLLFGYGITFDVENMPLAIVDYDHTALSRDYAYRFISSRYFDFKGYTGDERSVDAHVATNRLRAVIVIPEHFQRDLLAGRPARVRTLIDGTFPFRAQIAKGYVIAINSAASVELLAHHLARTRGLTIGQAQRAVEPVRLEIRYLYNNGLKSLWTLGPRLMMLILVVSPPFFTALGVVREKESGAIYNIYASTVSRLEFLAGKLSPYVAISMLDAGVLFLMARWLFGVPFKGDLAFLALATLLFVICTTGIGLTVSVLVRTQVAAMVVTSIVSIVPSVLYSGVLIPLTSLAPSARAVAHLLPSMYYNNIVVGCFLKGIGLEILWPETAVLAAYAAGLSALGYAMFHKRPAS